MIKLNYLQYNKLKLDFDLNFYSLDSLVENEDFETLVKDFCCKFNYKKIKTFSFSKSGFLDILLELKGKIAVSLGETLALIEACRVYESLGNSIEYLPLNKDGSVDFSILKEKDFDYIFCSSYVIDTFYIVDLKELKKLSKAKIISNASADFSLNSDIVYFDSYKLSGYYLSGVILLNDDSLELSNIGFTDSLAIKVCFEALKSSNKVEMKHIFIDKFKDKFKDNLYFFVDNKNTLANSFHIALKDIKAREIIRTLAFLDIYLSNGEGCSLGLSKPSRVIQAMGYSEEISRNALSFSFNKDLSLDEIDFIVDTIYKKYIQIKSFL